MAQAVTCERVVQPSLAIDVGGVALHCALADDQTVRQSRHSSSPRPISAATSRSRTVNPSCVSRANAGSRRRPRCGQLLRHARRELLAGGSVRQRCRQFCHHRACRGVLVTGLAATRLRLEQAAEREVDLPQSGSVIRRQRGCQSHCAASPRLPQPGRERPGTRHGGVPVGPGHRPRNDSAHTMSRSAMLHASLAAPWTSRSSA